MGRYYLTSLATTSFTRTLIYELRQIRNVQHQRRHLENVGTQTWTTIFPFWLSFSSSLLVKFNFRNYANPFVISFTCTNGIYEGRTESHEQLFLHANWEQQTKESAVVDGTSCCVILECLVTPIACIT